MFHQYLWSCCTGTQAKWCGDGQLDKHSQLPANTWKKVLAGDQELPGPSHGGDLQLPGPSHGGQGTLTRTHSTQQQAILAQQLIVEREPVTVHEGMNPRTVVETVYGATDTEVFPRPR